MTTTTLPRYAELSPAYGREIKNAAAVKLAFAQGEDFVYHTPFGTTYASIRDAAVGTTVQLRYNNFRSVTIFTVKQAHLDALAAPARPIDTIDRTADFSRGIDAGHESI